MAKQQSGNRPPTLDSVDRAILSELQANCRITNAALSERAGVSPPTAIERVKKLEKLGIITGYMATLDPEALGQELVAIVHVSIREHTATTLENAKKRFGEFDEVQACWYCAGDEDFILKARVENMAHLEEFITCKIASVEGIGKLRTNLVLRTLKDTPRVSVNLPKSDSAG